MDPSRFDSISKTFAERKLTRRRALMQGGAGIAAGAVAFTGLSASAQEATPEASQDATPAASDSSSPATLFLQSFQSGTIVPKEGEAGTWTLTLEQGLGQTLYFTDRPDRVVGATPTPQFLDALGFSPTNPPNAALLFEDENGNEDVSVVELFNPHYDTATNTATYDIQLLDEYARVGMTFQQQPTEPADAGATFGAAHLFIDDCADGVIYCLSLDTHYPCPGDEVYDDQPICGLIGPMGYCYDWSTPGCFPCKPYDNPPLEMLEEWWDNVCTNTFSDCVDGDRIGCYGAFVN
jgi:hypothetical protein